MCNDEKRPLNLSRDRKKETIYERRKTMRAKEKTETETEKERFMIVFAIFAYELDVLSAVDHLYTYENSNMK